MLSSSSKLFSIEFPDDYKIFDALLGKGGRPVYAKVDLDFSTERGFSAVFCSKGS